ncbi:DUF4231 domain-containing protein [Jiangella aurantiaca]|nr:DUF4231 domain-containing protein [Jiangella aurantiaca]
MRGHHAHDDIELPGLFHAADAASRKAQKSYLALSATRLVSLLAAATFGAIGTTLDSNPFAWAILGCFTLAAIAEILLITLQPERDWYSGRALAESIKTLAWRYSVGAEPFEPSLSSTAAASLLRARITEVVSKGKDRLDLDPRPAAVTDSMKALRSSELEIQRATYVKFRTQDQKQWYSNKGSASARWARRWRYLLLAGEITAVAAAGAAIGSEDPIDFAGLIAAIVASGAAWLVLKQYSQLASAYRIAAVELALQEDALRDVEAEDWSQAVANAEEAISREHTMWLASRGVE